jgi:arsenite methyltransferase
LYTKTALIQLKMKHQYLKRKFLLYAHDTELWASYRPRLPGWPYLLAALGVGIIAVALTIIPFTQPGIRILLVAGGILFGLPLVVLAVFARQNWQRRTAVRKQILDAIPWRGDEAVLDVGCGSGMLLNGAAARLETGSALGIDIWAEHGGGGNLDLLLKHARAENVADRIAFQEVDARQMPFEDASFDVVLSSWAIHHISRSRDDFEAVVQEILRVLKPGGTIVILDIAHMVAAIAIRMVKAGLQVEQQEAPLGQKMVVGKKMLTPIHSGVKQAG